MTKEEKIGMLVGHFVKMFVLTRLFVFILTYALYKAGVIEYQGSGFWIAVCVFFVLIFLSNLRNLL